MVLVGPPSPFFLRIELPIPSATQETPSYITHIPLPILSAIHRPQQLLRRSFRPCCFGTRKQRYINQLKLRWIISNPKFRNKTRISRVMSNSNSPLPSTLKQPTLAIHECTKWSAQYCVTYFPGTLNWTGEITILNCYCKFNYRKRKESSTVPFIWISNQQDSIPGSCQLWQNGNGRQQVQLVKKYSQPAVKRYQRNIFGGRMLWGRLLIGKYQSKSTQ